MQTFNTKSNIAVYYELTKPKIWYLLVFTAFGAAITASNVFNIPISLETWALLLGGVAAGSAAANTLTNYHDRDIDAIMERTKGRPIPSRRIYPAEKARNFGLDACCNIISMCFWYMLYCIILARHLSWFLYGVWISR